MRGNIGRSNNQKYLHNSKPKVSVTRASKQMGGKKPKHQYEDILKITREGGNYHKGVRIRFVSEVLSTLQKKRERQREREIRKGG